MKKHSFAAADGAPPVGPYSPAIGIEETSGGLLFLSGQIPLNAQGQVVGETAADQARQALRNMRSLLGDAGTFMDNVVKTTIFLADMADFTAVNEVYAEFFTAPFPARSTVAVAALPKGVKVEIEAIAAP
jgi:2-iminobutanoate/2-iminopropanoate deaminase